MANHDIRRTDQNRRHRAGVAGAIPPQPQCLRGGGVSVVAGDQVKDALEKEVSQRGLERHCQVRGVGCLGLCAEGPLVNVESNGKATMYQHVTAQDAPDVVQNLESPEPVERLVCPTDRPFFTAQKKIVLENCGVIDPERIEEYIATGGYDALQTVVTTMTPEEVIGQITRSGLRGRGGAGFPTGLKWSTVHKADGSGGKYIICNADEGDPGAFMDRSVLESDPHRVLEGMAIAAYAVGARQGFIYVRAEYPLAVKRLKLAIRQADRLGLLGNEHLRHDAEFQHRSANRGRRVCLRRRDRPDRVHRRPARSAASSSALPGRARALGMSDADQQRRDLCERRRRSSATAPTGMRRIGTEKSKGTKVFALAGRVNNTGLIEVPMGITLREIIFSIGGGMPDGRKFKAVQTGGPSGGCIPEQFLDMPVDYESLAKVGSIMGSGGMIVMDETSSMVDVARFFMEFCKDESCGKCVPCRVGTAQMLDLLNKLVKRQATQRDLDLLRELCDMVKSTSLCGLGQSAPNPVLTTLKYFHHEYEELLAAEEVPA